MIDTPSASSIQKVNLRSQEFLIDNKSRDNSFDIEKNAPDVYPSKNASTQEANLLEYHRLFVSRNPPTFLSATNHSQNSTCFDIERDSLCDTTNRSEDLSEGLSNEGYESIKNSDHPDCPLSSMNPTDFSTSFNDVNECVDDVFLSHSPSVAKISGKVLAPPSISTPSVETNSSDANYFNSPYSFELSSSSLPTTRRRRLNSTSKLVNQKDESDKDDATEKPFMIDTINTASSNSSLNSIKLSDFSNKNLSRYQHSHRNSDVHMSPVSAVSILTPKLESFSDPSEWTIERVTSWLEANNFPHDWIEIFQDNNINGQGFLALVSYQNLKALSLPTSPTMSGEPSRFIHMLRKILNRSSSSSSSATSQNYGKSVSSHNIVFHSPPYRELDAENMSNSLSKNMEGLSQVSAETNSIYKTSFGNPDGENSDETLLNLTHSKNNFSSASETHLRSESGSSVEFMITGPASTKYNGSLNLESSKHMSFHSESNLPVLRENKSLNPRPLTTYSANPARVSGSHSGQSPSSPSFTHGFFKRHNKSSSMDFSGLFSNSSANLAQNMTYTGHSGDDRPSKTPVKEINDAESKKSRGVLNRLWRRDKEKYDKTVNKDFTNNNPRRNFHAISPVSPIAPSFSSSNSNNVGFSVFKESTSTTYSLKDGMIPIKDSLLNQQRFLPIQKRFIERFIFVTTDNTNFIFTEITQIKTSQELKELIFQKIGIPILADCEFCLTDVGCDPGETLSEDAFRELHVMHSSRINNLKLFVKLPAPSPGDSIIDDEPSQLNYSSVTSTSPTASYEGDLSSGNMYPATPLYLYTEIPGQKNDEVDYFSALPQASHTSLVNELLVNKGSNKVSDVDPARKRTIRTHFKNDLHTDTIPENSNTHTDSIIDGGKASGPVRTRSTTLVALRNAPPPPIHGQNGLTRGLSVTSANFIEPPVHSFTPGSTEDLIPQPYVGLKRLVSRKPVSPVNSKKTFKKDFGEKAALENTSFSLDRKNSIVSYLERKNSILTVTKDSVEFVENEITFEGAPELEDSSSDSGSSDDGLWAKRPPINSGKKSCLVTKPFFRAPLRPELKVQIGNTSVIDFNENITSAVSPFLDTDRSKLVGESSDVRQLPSPNLGSGGKVWAVRPPAELLYDNLEKFFPNTDLDKPIIDDIMLSPPLSPNPDSVSPIAHPHLAVSPYSNGTPSRELSSSPLSSNTLAVSSTNYRGAPTSSNVRPDVLRSDNNIQGLQTTLPFNNPSTPTVNSQVTPVRTRAGRMKSIRVVAREASKRFKSNAQAEDSKKLLRRKSTKMWGQKVIEATPNEINCGHLSTLRDHQGYHKQFVWVKGELIGKGTFGKVYLALNVTTGEIMAVKQVRIPKAASDPTSERQQEALEALNAEVATMKDLDHLNIVQYLGFETFPNVYNLFLEYVPGGSVGTCLRLHGRFEHDVIKSLTKQVLLGLSYLHKCGILHRDLKADNLLLDLDGVCKISDFGISKRSNNIYANDAGMSMQGTIFWMAPEVIHNVVHNEKQGYSAKVDIWSLGCVVLEMFAGRRPWSNDEAIGAMYKLGKTRLAPPIPEDTLPYVLKKDKDFLDLCFTIDPELRPTANELLMNSFCELDDDFNFLDTKLARLIKFNDKRADGFPQLDKPSFDLPYS